MYARAIRSAAMVAIGVAGATWLAMAGRKGRESRVRSTSVSTGGRDAPSRRGDYDARSRAGSFNTSDQTAPYDPDLSTPYPSPGVPDRQRSAQADRWSHRGNVSDRLVQALPDHRALRGVWDQSPLLIGAVAALVGAVVGLSVPETEQEHQLMRRDAGCVVDTVQETVRDKVNQVHQVASDAVPRFRILRG